jgi:hypothetical protein
MLPKSFAFDETPAFGVETLNELIIEQYVYEQQDKPIVLLGSSIQTMIPPYECRPAEVATVYLQGRSGMSGLEVLRTIGAKPKVVLVEAATLAISVDRHLIGVALRPVDWQIRMLVPPLRHNRNWIVLINRKFRYERGLLIKAQRPPMTVDLPPQSIEQWEKEVLAARMAPYLIQRNNDSNIRISVAQLVPLVRSAQDRGAKVIFYNPADPRIASITPMKELKAAIQAALPDVEFIDPPDATLPLYRPEGMHIQEASGVLLFNYLMERAGVAARSQCTVRKPG